MATKLGIRNRNAVLYHQILKVKEPRIFNIGNYDILRDKVREKRIRDDKLIDVKNDEDFSLLFTSDYGIDHRIYPSTLDKYLEQNRDIELG